MTGEAEAAAEGEGACGDGGGSCPSTSDGTENTQEESLFLSASYLFTRWNARSHSYWQVNEMANRQVYNSVREKEEAVKWEEEEEGVTKLQRLSSPSPPVTRE